MHLWPFSRVIIQHAKTQDNGIPLQPFRHQVCATIATEMPDFARRGFVVAQNILPLTGA